MSQKSSRSQASGRFVSSKAPFKGKMPIRKGPEGSHDNPLVFDSDDENPREQRNQVQIDLTGDSPSPEKPPGRRAASGNTAYPKPRSRRATPSLSSKAGSSKAPSPILSDPNAPRNPSGLSRLPGSSSLSNSNISNSNNAKLSTGTSSSPKASRSFSIFPNTSGAQIKVSPNSPQNARTDTPLSSRIPATKKTENATPHIDSEEDESMDDFLSNRRRQISPGTPSRSSPRRAPECHKSLDSSIGTSSPFMERIQQQKVQAAQSKPNPRRRNAPPEEEIARGSASEQEETQIPFQCEKPTVKQLEKSLRDFEQGMRDEHALTVRWLLHDAKEAAKNRENLFMDKISPFASMKGVQLRPGEPAPQGAVTDKLESHVAGKTSSKSKFTKSHSVLVANTITDEVQRVPKYSSHTTVRRNILTADDEQLKFIPFLGDAEGSTKKVSNHKRLVKELEEAYSAKRSESSRDSEQTAQIRNYLSYWLEELNIGCTEQTLVHFLIDQDDKDDQDGGDLRWRRRDRKMILKSFGRPLTENIKRGAKGFSEAFGEVFKFALKDVLLPKSRVEELKASVKSQDAVADRLGTFTSLTCLICGAICCQTHGDYNRYPVYQSENSDNEEEPDEFVYELKPVVLKYDDLIRKRDARTSAITDDMEYEHASTNHHPCSPECHLCLDFSTREYEWPEDDEFKKMLLSFTNRNLLACDIACLIERPCWQVFSQIKSFDRDGGGEVTRPLSSSGRLKRPDWYDNKRKVLKGDWMDMTSAHLHQERCQANPCAHQGPCLSDCPCVRANILCESMCGCSDDCPRKFTGCSCSSNGVNCVSDSCICIQMNRECGPQCGSCGAFSRINPANKHDDELFATGCQNIVLQRAVPKRMVIGESQLEGVGFGAYLGEPVRKGDFLSEYTGEVISFNEAERRGIIYDRKYLSFLFDLNSEWTIDAARLGNKTRFINHADSEKDGLNCEAKIVLVNGEHRIKFTALRDIAVGEELLFNYGKKFAEKHGLSKKLPKAKEGGKKGVVVGEEALDALDGMDARNRETRGKMTAIRGGHRGSGGRGRNKARKTAPIRDTLKAAVETVEAVEAIAEGDDDEFDTPAEEEEEEGEEGEEERDEDDEDIRARRRKRKITRPARYTR